VQLRRKAGSPERTLRARRFPRAFETTKPETPLNTTPVGALPAGEMVTARPPVSLIPACDSVPRRGPRVPRAPGDRPLRERWRRRTAPR
jgi:hypothetical protein